MVDIIQISLKMNVPIHQLKYIGKIFMRIKMNICAQNHISKLNNNVSRVRGSKNWRKKIKLKYPLIKKNSMMIFIQSIQMQLLYI